MSGKKVNKKPLIQKNLLILHTRKVFIKSLNNHYIFVTQVIEIYSTHTG